MEGMASNDGGNVPVVAEGRRRVNRDLAQWAELVEAHRLSGLTVEAFCLQENVSKSSFTRWRGQLSGRVERVQNATDFLAIPIQNEGGIEVEVGGMRLRLDGSSSVRILEELLLRVRQAK